MVVLVIRHQEIPESSECWRNSFVCISEMEKRVPGAKLWCSLSPDHVFWELLPPPCLSERLEELTETAQCARGLLVAGKLLQRAQSLLSSSSSFLFVVAFWKKSPWNCPSSLPRSSLLLCQLLPAHIKQAVPLVLITGITSGSQSCLLPVVLKMQPVASGIRQSVLPSPIHPLPRILQGLCEAEIAFFS